MHEKQVSKSEKSLQGTEKLGNAPAKKIKDNRAEHTVQAKLQSIADVAQLRRRQRVSSYDAGSGGDWHIHAGHIKYNGHVNSRVNFNSRAAAAILQDVNDRVQRYNLPITSTDYQSCINYINRNY